MGGSVALLALYGLRTVRVTYLDGPRFVVRELEGYATPNPPSHGLPGLCVTVVDRAYCCQVIKRWTTEDMRGGSRELRRIVLRADAERLAAERNVKG